LGWPIWPLCRLLADGKETKVFSIYWQTAKKQGLCHLLADGKEARSLPSASRRQRTFLLCRPPADGKAAFTGIGFAGVFAVC
jgi:hypothetical protein